MNFKSLSYSRPLMTRPIGPHLVRTGGRGCPKGQFLAPWDVEHVIEKVISTSGLEQLKAIRKVLLSTEA